MEDQSPSAAKRRKKKPEKLPRSDQCAFFMERKRRRCNMQIVASGPFCAVHAAAEGVEGQPPRVPCPLDPSHSVAVPEIENHVKKCPSLKLALHGAPWYSPGFNLPPSSSSPSSAAAADDDDGKEDDESNVEGIADEKLASVARAVQGRKYKKMRRTETLSSAQVGSLIHKVKRAFEEIMTVNPTPHSRDSNDDSTSHQEAVNWKEILTQSRTDSSEDDVIARRRLFGSRERHDVQQTAIAECIRQAGMLQVPTRATGSSSSSSLLPPTIVEFGAGKARLSHAIVEKGARDVIAIERQPVKLKADRFIRSVPDAKIQRLRVDIEDLILARVPTLEAKYFIGVGKHLCGAGTDLAMRCCQRVRDEGLAKGESIVSTDQHQHQYQPHPPVWTGLAIATCCHHLCTWDSYIDPGFFEARGINSREFSCMTKMSSWAVDNVAMADHNAEPSSDAEGKNVKKTTKMSADGTASDISDHRAESESTAPKLRKQTVHGPNHTSVTDVAAAPMTAEERRKIGLMCKRLIDHGRIEWLRKQGFSSHGMEYVDRSVTPENALILAKTRQ